MYAYSQKPGTLDSSFAGNGWVFTDFKKGSNSLEEYCKQVLLQTDGSYIIAIEVDEHAVLIRYHPNGTLDSSFGAYGYSVAVHMYPLKAALQHDGKIVVAGNDYDFLGGNDDVMLIRFNTNGSLDNTFGKNGKVISEIGSGIDHATFTAIQNDGK